MKLLIQNCWTMMLFGMLMGISTLSIAAQSETSLQSTQPEQKQPIPYALRCAQLFDPIDLSKLGNNLGKLILAMRSADVPKETRRQIALRVVKVGFFDKPNVVHGEEARALFEAALFALSHLCIDTVDTEVIQVLEEYLAEAERLSALQQKSAELDESQQNELLRIQRRVVGSPNVVRALLAHLRAVQQSPQLRTPTDLERRIRLTLVNAGLTLEEARKQYNQDMELLRSQPHWYPSYATLVLYEIRRTLFHAVQRGIEVEPVVKALDLPPFEESVDVGRVGSNPRPFLEVAQIARSPEQIVDEMLHAVIYPYLYAQLLVDRGVSVVPLIVEKLEWARQNPDKVSQTRMGISALFEVLVALLGPEEALPTIEKIAFSKNEQEWFVRSASKAIEQAKQGRVYMFRVGF